jgi:hypothetical protein
VNATRSLPIVRLRLSCADEHEYRRKHAPLFARDGVFIRTDRIRPIGARVHLKIELLDRSFAYSGEAVVASQVNEGARLGFMLELAGPAAERGPARPRSSSSELLALPALPAPDAATPSTPTPAPTPAPAAAPTPTAPPARASGLAELLFSEQPDPEPAPGPKPVPLPAPSPTPSPAPATGLAELLFSEQPADPEPKPISSAGDDEDWSSVLEPDPGPTGAPAPEPTPEPVKASGPVKAPQPEVTPASGAMRDPFLEASLLPERDPFLEASSLPEQDPFLPATPPLEPTLALEPTPEQLQLPAATAPARRPPRRTLVLGAAALAAVAVSCAAVGLTLHARRRAAATEASFAREIRVADERIQSGRLAGAQGDAALDHLVAARGLLPEDPRLTSRLRLLANKFEELGGHAVSRGDLEEAAAHFEAVLVADPGRDAARRQLQAIASQRASAKGRGARP